MKSLRPTMLAAACLIALEVYADASPNLLAHAQRKSILRVSADAAKPDEVELLIYGPIGDSFWADQVSAQSVMAQLAVITASTIRVRINSDGGKVVDGLAIYNALRRHPARKIVEIDGIAASIASLVAMAGDEVVMPQNTMQMLHGPSAWAGGTAKFHRDVAQHLDTHAAAMATSYASKTGKPVEDIVALFDEDKDHYYTAAQAVEFGLADRVLERDAAEPPDDAAAAAALIAYANAIGTAPVDMAATLRKRIAITATRTQAFASLGEATQGAILAQIEDPLMKQKLLHLMVLASAGAAAGGAVTPPTPGTPAPVVPPAGGTADPAQALAALASRNTGIRAQFGAFRDYSGVTDLEAQCLADPALTLEAAQAKLLSHISAGTVPLNGGQGTGRIEGGQDERDKVIEAASGALLARASVLKPEESDRICQGNVYAGRSLLQIAEAFAKRAGVQGLATMGREDLAQAVLRVRAQQGVTDFPLLMERTANQIMLAKYRIQEFTWRLFCKVGSLSDLRDHDRYHMGSFGDFEEVDEHGNYKDGVLSDGEKQTVRGKRKGRILRLTPDALINDSLGMFADIAAYIGQSAGRTIEKDVYALFALNGGLGPTMGDGKALFHADHKNVSAVGVPPSVDAWEAMNLLMGSHKDPGGNDDLDLSPHIWLGPKSLSGKAFVVNNGEWDPDVENKTRLNPRRAMFKQLIETGRLTGAPWYGLADPNVEPVFEVSFLEGRQEPRLTQENDFRSSGLAWKGEHAYAVGAIGWRGIAKNPGTGGG